MACGRHPGIQQLRRLEVSQVVEPNRGEGRGVARSHPTGVRRVGAPRRLASRVRSKDVAVRLRRPNMASISSAAARSARTSPTSGGCCSRCGCDGAEASLATLRCTTPHRSAWFSEARRIAWTWRSWPAPTPLSQLGVQPVDVEGLQLRQANRSEYRSDLPVDVLLIVVQRRLGSSQPGDVLHPSLEQLGQRHVVERGLAGGNRSFEISECGFHLALRGGLIVRITRRYRPVEGSRPADTTSSHVPGVRSRIVPIRTILPRQIRRNRLVRSKVRVQKHALK